MKSRIVLQQISKGGETFFAITQGPEILSDLRHCVTWAEARAALRQWKTSR